MRLCIFNMKRYLNSASSALFHIISNWIIPPLLCQKWTMHFKRDVWQPNRIQMGRPKQLAELQHVSHDIRGGGERRRSLPPSEDLCCCVYLKSQDPREKSSKWSVRKRYVEVLLVLHRFWKVLAIHFCVQYASDGLWGSRLNLRLGYYWLGSVT